MSKDIFVASSPCSFGIYYGQTIVVDPDQYVEDSAAAGYDGVDLGPAGFLGTVDEMSERLRRARMGLAGAYISFSELGELGSEQERARIDDTLTRFDAAREASPDHPAPVLTFGGTAATSLHLSGWRQARYGGQLAPAAVGQLRARIDTIAGRVARAGYAACIHPHLSTEIETWADTIPVLGYATGVCVDTGHLFLAGDDPIEVIRRAERLELLHIKDASRSRWIAGLAAEDPGTHPWRSAGFTELGHGDLPLSGIVEALNQRAYSGWVVVEQDLPVGGAGQSWSDMLAAQRRNREHLAALGL